MNYQFSVMLNQFRNILSQRGINIPENINNNPDAIIQYMMNNGVITQNQYNLAKQFLNQRPTF